MQFVVNPLFSRATVCALATGLLWLTGCASSGNAQNNMAQRAEAQQEVARLDSVPVQTDSRATYVQLVMQMQQKGLYFASLAHIEALQQRWGVDAESNLLLADALRQTGQADKANKLYSQLLTTPVKARAAHGLGLLAGRANDFDAAVKYLQDAAQLAPTDANILNDLGFSLLQQGKWAAARVPLLKAAELASDNPRVWSNIALFLTLDGQQEQANDVMEGRKLSSTSRAQIAELARSIGQRWAPVSAAPPIQTHSGVASAKLVLSPTLGLTRLAPPLGGAVAIGAAEASPVHPSAN